ncbi:MAG: bifunctional phosphoribosylaminoimidazolecarboxamide formyltransferase/IMP cyclohydrolase [Ignavibacteria bacterium]
MKRALISVYDKSGIVDFARSLVDKGYEIVSTSGTAKLLTGNGIKIKTIEELTKSPEVLNGRVKTLHPLVFAGILADKHNDEHLKQVALYGFELFDVVVVSLYPFSETIKKEGCTVPEAIEQIDIGGVSLIRAAAKNYGSVSVIVKPEQYNRYLDNTGNIDIDFNLKLAAEAFEYISIYDKEISGYFKKLAMGLDGDDLNLHFVKGTTLRYGENPHQKARIYSTETNGFDSIIEKLHGKELSYINILDIDASYQMINEFDEPACVIVKHTNPSGAACAENILDAYKRAFACDTVSPYGGIVTVNRKLDLNTAAEIDKIFTEIIIAPGYDDDAFNFLLKKKNRRLIKYNTAELSSQLNLKSVTGGLLVQDNDMIVVNESEMKCVTERKPTVSEVRDLMFAMKIAKHTKSNSVVYAKNLQTVGIGGGQPSRVDSSRLAVQKAKRFGMDIEGSSVASDAYFPFADGLIEAANAGAKSAIEPGGSVNDEEVIKAANEHGLAMLFTGIRHFRH